MTHEDIFDHGELVKQYCLLVRRGDSKMESGFGVRDGNVITIEHDTTRIRCVDAGQNLDKSRLAGAVFADEGGYCARIEPEVHSLEGLYARKRLRNSNCIEDRAGCGLSHRE